MLLLIVSWRDCKIWGDANLVTGGQVDTMADAGLDVGGGRDDYNTPGASCGQGISGVIGSVISNIYTFIIIKCRQVNLQRVNDRRTTYLIWCAYLQLDICFMIYISICGRWMSIDYNEFTINWVDFAANENSYFARVLLRYQSCSIFYTLENLEC